MIHWNYIVYGIIALPLLIFILKDFFEDTSGGLWSSGKDSFDLGFVGIFLLIVLLAWTAIWGGIFWW